MNPVRVGYTLMPRLADLEQLAELLEHDVDYYEVAPETLWRVDARGEWIANGYHARALELKARTHRPIVAHGVGLSVGTLDPRDRARQTKWLERIRTDHEFFQFDWYTDHLGTSILGADQQTLPLPLPMASEVARACRERLVELQSIVPDVGLENSAVYHHYGDPLDEPAFLNELLDAPRLWQVLDLHNVWTVAVNAGFDPSAYLARVDLANVIEIHVSGGAWTDPAWFPGERKLRLDSHDAAVPEEVWELLDEIAPRCPNLRGITLERMEGTLEPGDEVRLRAELARVRRAAARCAPNRVARKAAEPTGAASAELAPYVAFENALARALRERDSLAALRREVESLPVAQRDAARAWLAAIDARGFALSALFADRLRFERLVQASREASEWFERDPADFARAFRRYRDAVAPSALHPWGEKALFDAWRAEFAHAPR
ncbi:MAG: DUF692 family protein [Planctomycetota bacterium]|nr:MAG: DUF692 family protein [Planctomycetota bacterium]